MKWKVAENEVERIVSISPEKLEERREEKNHHVIMDEVLSPENRAKSKLPTDYYCDELFMILAAGVEVSFPSFSISIPRISSPEFNLIIHTINIDNSWCHSYRPVPYPQQPLCA